MRVPKDRASPQLWAVACNCTYPVWGVDHTACYCSSSKHAQPLYNTAQQSATQMPQQHLKRILIGQGPASCNCSNTGQAWSPHYLEDEMLQSKCRYRHNMPVECGLKHALLLQVHLLQLYQCSRWGMLAHQLCQHAATLYVYDL